MAYQFFAKAPAQKQRKAAASSPPSLPASLSKQQPPRHPPPLVLPQSTSSFPANKPPSIGDPAFQPVPFTEPIASYQTPHPHITIDQVRTAHIQSLTRITSLLLPVRYSGSFYTACITDPVVSSLARVAVYHDHPVTAGPTVESTAPGGLGGTDKVIGGIRCRLEKLPAEFAGRNNAGKTPPTNLYIQTLHLLSPHRGNGVAAALLHALLYSEPTSTSSAKSTRRVSPLVRHYNIRTVTAHVHETNEDGLNWYVARGFRIEDGVIKGYYRRLNPGGAKVVRLDLDWEDQEEEKKHQEKQAHSETKNNDDDDDDDDDDWEKLEAEDDDDVDDHGVVHLSDSRILDGEEDSQSTANSVKRKRADDEQ